MSHELRRNAVRDVVSDMRTTNEEIGTHYTRLGWYSSFEGKQTWHEASIEREA